MRRGHRGALSDVGSPGGSTVLGFPTSVGWEALPVKSLFPRHFNRIPLNSPLAFDFSLSTPSAMTSQLHKKGEAWSARFNEPMSDLVKRERVA
jgi:hypothetical protein